MEKTFGEFLTEKRKEKKLTQKELSKMLRTVLPIETAMYTHLSRLKPLFTKTLWQWIKPANMLTRLKLL